MCVCVCVSGEISWWKYYSGFIDWHLVSSKTLEILEPSNLTSKRGSKKAVLTCLFPHFAFADLGSKIELQTYETNIY